MFSLDHKGAGRFLPSETIGFDASTYCSQRLGLGRTQTGAQIGLITADMKQVAEHTWALRSIRVKKGRAGSTVVGRAFREALVTVLAHRGPDSVVDLRVRLHTGRHRELLEGLVRRARHLVP